MRTEKIIVSGLIILSIIFVIYLFYKRSNESFQNASILQIIEKESERVQSEFENSGGFEELPDPVNDHKLLKFMKFNKNTNFIFSRSNTNMDKDFSLGLYFKKKNKGEYYKNFIRGVTSTSKQIFSVDLDIDKIKITYGEHEFSPEIDLSENIDSDSDMSYLFFRANINNGDENPTLEVIYNNKEIVNASLPELTHEDDLILKDFLFGDGFEGIIGQILIYNEIVGDSTRCRYYNCNINCFVPSGDTDYDGDVNECIKDCMKTCNDVEKCQKICVNCEVEGKFWSKDEKQKRCPWLKEIKKEIAAPASPQIRGFPGDAKILVEWKKPYDNNGEITNYIVLYYETFNRSSGANVSISGKSDTDICEYEIKNLKNRTYYDIVIRAVNSKGIGDPSNVLTIAPNGNIVSNNNRNIFSELEDELQKDVDNTEVNFVCNTNNFDSIGHSLDFYDDDMIDIKSYIEKLKN